MLRRPPCGTDRGRRPDAARGIQRRMTTFSAYMQKVIGSSAGDWNVIAQTPHLPQLRMVPEAGAPGQGRHHLAVEYPSYSMAMKSDLAITLVAGIVCAQTFADPWASAFGDAHTEYLVCCFNGTPIYRTLYVAVDNERCWLPLPRAGGNQVPQPYATLVRLLNELTREVPYDDYFARAGLTVVDESWPD